MKKAQMITNVLALLLAAAVHRSLLKLTIASSRWMIDQRPFAE